MFALIGWCLFGLFAGLLSRAITPGHAKLGFFGTIVLGILGSLLGGTLALLFSRNESGWKGIQPAGFIGAVIGGVIILMIPRLLLRRPRD